MKKPDLQLEVRFFLYQYELLLKVPESRKCYL